MKWRYLPLALLLVLLVVVPVGGVNLVIFEHNYSTIGSVPDNLTILNPLDPFTTNILSEYGGNGTVMTKWNNSVKTGQLFIGGFSPAVETTYNIKFSLNRTSSSSTINMRGQGFWVEFKRWSDGTYTIYQFYEMPGNTTITSRSVTTAVQPVPATLSILFNGTNQTTTATLGSSSITSTLIRNGETVPYSPISGNLIRFYAIPHSSETNESLILYEINQTIIKTGNITAIGNGKIIPFGIDGPHAPGTWENISAAIGNTDVYTIFADTGYLGGAYTPNVVNVSALINNGHELSLHSNSTPLASYPMDYALASIDQNYAELTSMFGKPPTSFGSIASDCATYAYYAATNHGLIWRDGQFGLNSMGSDIGTFQNASWPFYNNLSAAGIILQLLTHETDKTPAIQYSIDESKFLLLVDRYHQKGVNFTSFINWYKAGANTKESTFTENADANSLLNFTANTNGYDAMAEVDIAYNSTYHIVNTTSSDPVSFEQSADGKIKFYVEDDTTYRVLDDDVTAPVSISGISNSTPPTCNRIDWSWAASPDPTCWRVNVYRNNTFVENLSCSATSALWTGLPNNTAMTISTHTEDVFGNVNATWVNSSATTAECDLLPPLSISNLSNNTPTSSEIVWTWTNPADSDYSHLVIYRNNTFWTNNSNSTATRTWTGLPANTSMTFSSYTCDLNGLCNGTWVNKTANTSSSSGSTTPTPTTTIWTLAHPSGTASMDSVFAAAFALLSTALVIIGAGVVFIGFKEGNEKAVYAGIVMFATGAIMIVIGLSAVGSIFSITGAI